jgi:phosphonate metabolism protein PhnN/1,5-bisphosphokinase (PRPP-forming)
MTTQKICLIVGASGVGKDTLLKAIKDTINANFVKRYITREPDNNESNFYLDKEAFENLEKISYFVSGWKAHDNYYGIAKSHIKDGLNIISISREAIKDFEKVFENVTTIEIGIPKEMLYMRLKNRGREDEEAILKRIERSEQKIEAKNLIYFDNSNPIEQSKEEFLKLLKSV